MFSWGPVKLIESSQHDDEASGIRGDLTGVNFDFDGSSSGARIQMLSRRYWCGVQAIPSLHT
jgi:hypothetical protein